MLPNKRCQTIITSEIYMCERVCLYLCFTEIMFDYINESTMALQINI